MWRLLLCTLAFLVMAGPAFAQAIGDPVRYTMEDEVSDLLKRYVESRVDRPFFWKPCLNIGGDVRFEYNHYNSRRSFFSKDSDKLFVVARETLTDNPYYVNANVYFEFDTRSSWAKFQIEAVNPGGTFPKTIDRIRVKRAIMGYNFWKDSCSRGYAELGRQRLCEHFESEVQYGSRLDGIFGRVSNCLSRLGESYVQGGYMIVDARIAQYAFIVEAGAMDLFDQCLYVKASLVDWTNGGRFKLRLENGNGGDGSENGAEESEVERNIDLGYRVGQLAIGKEIACFWKKKPLKLFGGLLYNFVTGPRTAFEKNLVTKKFEEKRQYGNRCAGYVGFQLGKVCSCGDWAIKACYQYVQPYSILPTDNSGIGRTNAGDDAFLFADFGTLVVVTNYQGVDTEIAYAISDHITARAQYQHANEIAARLGGPSRFDRFMIRLIYAF